MHPPPIGKPCPAPPQEFDWQQQEPMAITALNVFCDGATGGSESWNPLSGGSPSIFGWNYFKSLQEWIEESAPHWTKSLKVTSCLYLQCPGEKKKKMLATRWLVFRAVEKVFLLILRGAGIQIFLLCLPLSNSLIGSSIIQKFKTLGPSVSFNGQETLKSCFYFLTEISRSQTHSLCLAGT